MAVTNPQTEKYFSIVNKINRGESLSDEDYIFYLKTTPEIDEQAILDYNKEIERAKNDPSHPAADSRISYEGMQESYKKLLSSPEHKERLARLAEENSSKKLGEDISKGLNLILGARAIGVSTTQINAANKLTRQNKRPYRPAVPQRDQLLANALRQAQEGTFDTERAIAPVRAEIQDQYYNDLANAKAASGGQSAAYGVYAQQASNNRRRAALGLAPIQDQIRRGQQERYDNLIGARMDETQRMFENNNSLYGNDLDFYYKSQDAASKLGAVGRENLNNSLYNFANVGADAAANYYTTQKYRNLKNRAMAAGLNPDIHAKIHQTTDGYATGNYSSQYNFDPQSVYDAFNKYNYAQ